MQALFVLQAGAPPTSMDSHRHFVKSSRCLTIKVGTNVITRLEDGKFALGHIGSLCEQVKELVESGIEVIVVTSGAVGMGYRLLRHHRTLNSSFADLEKPESQLDGKACAAVGQSGLITLYDTLFSLDNGIIFSDNDSLAALLALEVKADLLIFLMYVDGLYTKPPSQPGSKLIHTYFKEKHMWPRSNSAIKRGLAQGAEWMLRSKLLKMWLMQACQCNCKWVFTRWHEEDIARGASRNPVS